MKTTSKYIVAAVLGGLLCTGVGFAAGKGADGTTSAGMTKVQQEMNAETQRSQPETGEDLHGERPERPDTDGRAPMDGMDNARRGERPEKTLSAEKVQELYNRLSDEDKKTVQSLLKVTEADMKNLSEEKLESLKTTFESLSEENQDKLKDILKALRKDKGQRALSVKRLEAVYEKLSDEDKKTVQTLLKVTDADMKNLSEEKREALKTALESLSEDNQTRLKEILRSVAGDKAETAEKTKKPAAAEKGTEAGQPEKDGKNEKAAESDTKSAATENDTRKKTQLKCRNSEAGASRTIGSSGLHREERKQYGKQNQIYYGSLPGRSALLWRGLCLRAGKPEPGPDDGPGFAEPSVRSGECRSGKRLCAGKPG